MSGIKIKGTGRFVPAKVITNDYLAIVDHSGTCTSRATLTTSAAAATAFGDTYSIAIDLN